MINCVITGHFSIRAYVLLGLSFCPSTSSLILLLLSIIYGHIHRMALQISASHQSDSIRCIRKSSNIEKSCCCQFCVNKFAFCGAHVGELHGGMYVLCLRVLVQLSLRPSQRSLCGLSVLSVAHSLINVNQVNDSAASQNVRTPYPCPSICILSN